MPPVGPCDVLEKTIPQIDQDLLDLCRPRRPALVVGREADRAAKIAREEGYAVARCPGPEAIDCPLLRSEPCELRDDAGVAVIRIPPFASSDPHETAPFLPCATEGDSPSLILLAARSRPLDFEGKVGIMGENRGPAAIAGALKRVTARSQNAS